MRRNVALCASWLSANSAGEPPGKADDNEQSRRSHPEPGDDLEASGVGGDCCDAFSR